MTCLVHDTHYRSLFHAVVNELRDEKRTPAFILRNMPRKCCTCNDIDNLTLVSVLIHDKDQLINLKNMINRVDHAKQSNPKLVLALNRLENYIKENRGQASVLPSTQSVDSEMEEDRLSNHSETSDSSSSESEKSVPMETEKSTLRQKTKQGNKPPKPVKTGTFLFLPYKFEDKKSSDSTLIAAKALQRGRFIGRHGYIATLEKQYNVCINMITSKTTEQVTLALDNAKSEIGKVTVHNRKDLIDGEHGEWILVRSKKTRDKKETTDFPVLLDELTNRWASCLKMSKRKHEDEDEEHPSKK